MTLELERVRPRSGRGCNSMFTIESSDGNGKANGKSKELNDELNSILIDIALHTDFLNSSLTLRESISFSEHFMKNALEIEAGRERGSIELHDTSK